MTMCYAAAVWPLPHTMQSATCWAGEGCIRRAPQWIDGCRACISPATRQFFQATGAALLHVRHTLWPAVSHRMVDTPCITPAARVFRAETQALSAYVRHALID